MARGVTFDRKLISAIQTKFLSQIGSKDDDYNAKDINNILGFFVADHIKRRVSEAERDVFWGATLNDLKDCGKLQLLSGPNLAILSNLVASSGAKHPGFWDAMTTSFTKIEFKLNLIDFLTISKAFKVAHTIDERVYVEQALVRLSEARSVSWQIISLLISTLNLVS